MTTSPPQKPATASTGADRTSTALILPLIKAKGERFIHQHRFNFGKGLSDVQAAQTDGPKHY
jgi:hypothetical protein